MHADTLIFADAKLRIALEAAKEAQEALLQGKDQHATLDRLQEGIRALNQVAESCRLRHHTQARWDAQSSTTP